MALARLEELGERAQGSLADLPDIPWSPRWKNNADLFLQRLDHHCTYIANCAKDLAEKFRVFIALSERLAQIDREKDAPARQMMQSAGDINAAYAEHLRLWDEANGIRQLEGALEQAIFLRFANLRLAFDPPESSRAVHLDLQDRIEMAKAELARDGANKPEAEAAIEALKVQGKSEAKAWDKIRKRRGLYLRTMFADLIPEPLVTLMDDADRRNGFAHADERIDHGTFEAPVWRWENQHAFESIISDLTRLADDASQMGFAIHKYRTRLRRQRGEG